MVAQNYLARKTCNISLYTSSKLHVEELNSVLCNYCRESRIRLKHCSVSFPFVPRHARITDSKEIGLNWTLELILLGLTLLVFPFEPSININKQKSMRIKYPCIFSVSCRPNVKKSCRPGWATIILFFFYPRNYNCYCS